MAIRTRSDYFGAVETTVRTEELARTSRLVSRLTGYPVQYNKAVVGRNAVDAHRARLHPEQQRVRGVVAAELAGLPLARQQPRGIAETRLEALLERHAGVGRVDLVEVDGSDAEPSSEMKSTPFGGSAPIRFISDCCTVCCANTVGFPDASTAPDMRA